MMHASVFFLLLLISASSFVLQTPNRPQTSLSSTIRFLGQAENAIVRLGSVLLSPSHEYHHYYRNSAIYIYNMGYDDGEYRIRGLILDHPTPFTLQEMVDEPPPSHLAGELLFRGGDVGDGVVLLHNCSDWEGSVAIGSTGLYHGGWEAAMETQQQAGCRLFFQYCEFTELQLENMLDAVDDETGEGWIAVEVDNDTVLSTDWDRRGMAWSVLRSKVRDIMPENT